jgi:hypothetical protein
LAVSDEGIVARNTEGDNFADIAVDIAAVVVADFAQKVR